MACAPHYITISHLLYHLLQKHTLLHMHQCAQGSSDHLIDTAAKLVIQPILCDWASCSVTANSWFVLKKHLHLHCELAIARVNKSRGGSVSTSLKATLEIFCYPALFLGAPIQRRLLGAVFLIFGGSIAT
ncbi:hypothetical protein BC834DRAFT_626488 [Gloeopeniophorella convolvens]|nr:hypothetical protein BC834DRAFT_626488 [Gloeopeniophorella convolvens]